MDFELPHPGVLWVRAVVTDLLFAAFPGDVYEPGELAECVGETTVVAGGRLDTEDCAGNWFAVVRYPGDRAVLFGWDRENNVYDKPYDPRAAAPEWVRAIELKAHHPRVLTADAVSFVRWWENDHWSSTPTEYDDGLYMCLREIAGPAGLAYRVEQAHENAANVAFDDDTLKDLDHVGLDELTSLTEAAERHEVCEEDLNFLEPEVARAAYDYLRQAGITFGAPQTVEPLPAGT
ncbi:hypothetical protein ABZ319_32995 [Nocardia sp. NPDC005978]|uniref:hypothetical protein n=1 Tax=Nocardia sp. NPDC005978 TaxID=3156725 RepID=UPI0033BBC1CF